jgi:hypothetical protein
VAGFFDVLPRYQRAVRQARKSSKQMRSVFHPLQKNEFHRLPLWGVLGRSLPTFPLFPGTPARPWTALTDDHRLVRAASTGQHATVRPHRSCRRAAAGRLTWYASIRRGTGSSKLSMAQRPPAKVVTNECLDVAAGSLPVARGELRARTGEHRHGCRNWMTSQPEACHNRRIGDQRYFDHAGFYCGRR